MNWKKVLLIGAVVGAFAFVSAPKSEARVSIGIGIGLPLAFPVVGVGYYPGAYPYGCGYGVPVYASYGYYGYSRPIVYRRPVIYRRPVVVLRNGHRVYRRR